MSLTLKPGVRLFSSVCSTELIAVKASGEVVEITIGGVAAVTSADAREPGGSIVDGHGGGTTLGKRYVDAADTIELLCTKPGDGMPALDGQLLVSKESKALPASD